MPRGGGGSQDAHMLCPVSQLETVNTMFDEDWSPKQIQREFTFKAPPHPLKYAKLILIPLVIPIFLKKREKLAPWNVLENVLPCQ